MTYDTIRTWLHHHRLVIAVTLLLLIGLGGVQLATGSLPWGPDGQFGWWEGSIHSSENSQRVADAYSFSHIVHGILLYAGLWLVARKIPTRFRFLIAVVLEVGWELLENSTFVINRYRTATIALGYVGDSVLNSIADVVMMGIGFIIARLSKPWVTIAIILVLEIGCLIWVRDNLTLNILMLLYPSEVIKMWQAIDMPK